ncbi:MAG: hypothetical protein LC113_12835 [Acidobacteria bacterium]|nr:hypothetical protein [Acidobacteriota bacterium]
MIAPIFVVFGSIFAVIGIFAIVLLIRRKKGN